MLSGILCVFATTKEAEALTKMAGISYADNYYRIGDKNISLLITGVGSVSTSWSLQNWLSGNIRPDIIVNCGIAGSFNDGLNIGDVVMPVTDCFADSGIEDGEKFMTLFEAGLEGYNKFPFNKGVLQGDQKIIDNLKDIIKPANAVTVNTATGSVKTKNKLVKKFNPDIETMEGATFFYLCIREKIPFLALRSVSNMVERRNRDNWNIGLAIENLSEKLKDVITRLS